MNTNNEARVKGSAPNKEDFPSMIKQSFSEQNQTIVLVLISLIYLFSPLNILQFLYFIFKGNRYDFMCTCTD